MTFYSYSTFSVISDHLVYCESEGSCNITLSTGIPLVGIYTLSIGIQLVGIYTLIYCTGIPLVGIYTLSTGIPLVGIYTRVCKNTVYVIVKERHETIMGYKPRERVALELVKFTMSCSEVSLEFHGDL